MSGIFLESIPNLELSPSERHDVIEMTANIIADALRVERQYMLRYGELSKSEWKHVRSARGGLKIYKERRRLIAHGRPSASNSDSGSEKIDLEEVDWPDTSSVNDSIYSDSLSGSFSSDSIPIRLVNQVRDDITSSNTVESSSHSSGRATATPAPVNSRVPMVVGAGHVEGTFEDVAMGLYAGDLVSWHERNTYIKEAPTQSRILSTILEPTQEDPFRFLGIKWFIAENHVLYGSLFQDRDFFVIEANGITQDEYGAPHGYYVMHSFRHPLVPEFTERKVLRCEISLCIISRQVGPNKVHLFNRGFIDLKGALTASISITISTKRLSTSTKATETALSRKLVWLMRQRQRSRMQLASGDSEASSLRTCEACTKTFRFLSGSLSFCQVCNKCVCSKCTVKCKVVVDATKNSASRRLMPFCAACVLEAKHLPPHQVALDTNVRSRTLQN
ncbi:hypothetical protein Poli38472_012546 [Pythium oligandrum]|uniref:FYVE-type domain-containing protein n=1 Tax=Pythium oligandrum TaxID=41045 RepID=A0A8K1CEJ3_PYTOL|nr:hypothetical protein Poli38472_012546 [Pythium oligandrum]|eukprot:TMW61355.1 hypothetical protein Poli38472_012546 [Pythium oligandrum]